MPNYLQWIFLLSSFATFFLLHSAFAFFFPDLFGRHFLFSSKVSNEKQEASMALPDFLMSNPLAGLAITVVLGWVVVSWFSGNRPRKPVLDPKDYKEFPLVEKIVISPNTALYRFGLPHPEDQLGVPIGQHITVAADINGKLVARSYTPTSSDDDKGHFDLVIKSYEQGNISKFVGNLKLGEKIKVRGPKGQFKYTPGIVREFAMIAGGTGITPMYQIITHVLYNSQDTTKISLIYANQTDEDILLRSELDELAARHKDRFKVYYVLNTAPANWKGGVGFVSKDMIKERCAAPADDMKMLICGPPPMVQAMKKHLTDLDYAPAQTISKAHDQVFVF
ncbi:NADH-cytochrome b5 reductase [Tulasnella sp. 419]|nr:NADH-cytochrome b5 reductase [Tulasnella sp. 419]